SGSASAAPPLRKRTFAVSVFPLRRNSVTSAETPAHLVCSRARTPAGGAPAGAAAGAAAGGAAAVVAGGTAAVATMPGATAAGAVAAGRGASRLQAIETAATHEATTPAAFDVMSALLLRVSGMFIHRRGPASNVTTAGSGRSSGRIRPSGTRPRRGPRRRRARP